MRKFLFGIGATTVLAGALCVMPILGGAASAAEQFVPITIYRTGPYAVGGSGIMGGYMDYMAMLNARDGGINGVKLTWEECETAYKPDRMVECYERLKNKGPTGASMFNPLGTGLTYAILEKAAADKIPVVTLGYGRTDASDGRVFPYIFPLLTNYWSQSTAKIKFIGQRVGGMDKLKDMKIAHIHHDSAYGKETIPVLKAQAEKYGFAFKNFPVTHPGLDQKSTWLQLRRYKPDYVILRGWGVMNGVALKEAARINFPREKMIGVWWSGSEEDVLPAGPAAKGYISAGFHPSGDNFSVIQDIRKHVYAKDNGNLNEERIGTIYYNRGVIHGIVNTEAIRSAQNIHGKKSLTGEQVRDGIEALNITEARLKELGADGLMAPIKITCRDHEGGGAVKFQQWDGRKWEVITDWIKTDQSIVRPMIEASAKKYADENQIKMRDC